MVRLRRYKSENTPFFITTSTFNNQKFFLSKDRAGTVIDYIYRAKERMIDFLLAFAVMPEHLHLLIIPKNEFTISQIMLFIKKGSSRVIHIKENTNGHLWAKRFFDRGIRSEQELIETIEYIHNNPLKTRLAAKAENYLFSSANPRWKTDLELYFDQTR
jgi:REP element-mobilizing transposase RayT